MQHDDANWDLLDAILASSAFPSGHYLKEQSHILKQMQEALAWDDSESAWNNFCRIGINAASVLPISDLFFKA